MFPQFDNACKELTAFVLATMERERIGFIPDANAPQTFDDLKKRAMFLEEYHWKTNKVLRTTIVPVWTGESEHSIYGSAAGNYCARAWHDYVHLTEDLNFSRASERQVAYVQRDYARVHGLSEEATKVLWFDTEGQQALFEKHGRFPANQRAWVAFAFVYGLHAAVEAGPDVITLARR